MKPKRKRRYRCAGCNKDVLFGTVVRDGAVCDDLWPRAQPGDFSVCMMCLAAVYFDTADDTVIACDLDYAAAPPSTKHAVGLMRDGVLRVRAGGARLAPTAVDFETLKHELEKVVRSRKAVRAANGSRETK